MDDEAVAALLTEMLRAGALDPAIVQAAADRCEREGHDMAAHRLRCLELEANATPEGEWSAQRARARLRVVSDGGNGVT